MTGRFVLFVLLVAIATLQCSAQCPASLSGIASTIYTVPTGQPGMIVEMMVCGTLPQGCATPGGGQICTGAGCCSICQEWNKDQPNAGAACLGKFVSSSLDGSTVELKYTGGDPVPPPGPPDPGPREAIVRLTCGSAAFGDALYVDASNRPKDGNAYVYEVDAKSSYACGGVSGGTVFIIILICLIVVYIVAGIIVNKFVRHEETMDKIFPHFEFWKESPILAKEGTMFVLSKVTGGRVGYSSV